MVAGGDDGISFALNRAYARQRLETEGVFGGERLSSQILVDKVLRGRSLWEDQGKVVAAQIAGDTALARQPRYAFRDRLQRLVASLAPVPFVEELKVLDIEVNRLVALRRVVRHEFVSFTEERACVVQSCQRIAFFEKQHLRILGARFSFADFVVDIRYEAHDHRLAAFAALHGHDGLRRPTPSACGEQLAELCT